MIIIAIALCLVAPVIVPPVFLVAWLFMPRGFSWGRLLFIAFVFELIAVVVSLLAYWVCCELFEFEPPSEHPTHDRIRPVPKIERALYPATSALNTGNKGTREIKGSGAYIDRFRQLR